MKDHPEVSASVKWYLLPPKISFHPSPQDTHISLPPKKANFQPLFFSVLIKTLTFFFFTDEWSGDGHLFKDFEPAQRYCMSHTVKAR